jgi:beta-N-acetylhexosaminidase
VAAQLVLVALLASACAGSQPPPPRLQAPEPPVSGQLADPSADPPCTPEATLEERAARVLMVGLPEVRSSADELVGEVLRVGVGGVLLTHTNVENQSQVQGLVSTLRARSRSPLVVAADEEPGRVRTFSELFGDVPSARRLAAQQTAAEVESRARTAGAGMAAIGITVNFAPVADLDDGPWNGIVGDRSFSADPTQASEYALAYARGLKAGGVTPVVKHFPGHGRASDDSHIQLPRVDVPLDVLRATDLRPFVDAVAAGAPVVMLGHVAYDALDPSLPASLSPAAYRLLREIGFTGVAITDSIGMGAVNLRWDFDEAVVLAVAAGADGVLATDGRQAERMRDALVDAVRQGRLDERRLDQAAGRMMALAGGDPRPFSCAAVDLPQLR